MSSPYPLGTTDLELERLDFQHAVWGGHTRAFFDRLRIGTGARVLDLGCGTGAVTYELAERVGTSGSVTAIDESPRWIEHVEREIERRGLRNVSVQRSRIEDLNLPVETFDVVFARWVFSFLSEPDAVARTLARALVPGGVLMIQDYNHEGISVFPESDAFRAVVRATRATYAQAGGDAWVAGRVARIFVNADLDLVDLQANALCGGPSSPVFRWADAFFPHFSGVMEANGTLSATDRAQFLSDWQTRKRDPDALFFSPLVVDAAGRKRGP
ncbi:MAG: methyltransferase domain-containing protein [Planctomycetes bacterium]|nr:methyltransferase domain-containing protein [Planctomycetota bacterium]